VKAQWDKGQGENETETSNLGVSTFIYYFTGQLDDLTSELPGKLKKPETVARILYWNRFGRMCF
jgi:hypothetical protein